VSQGWARLVSLVSLATRVSNVDAMGSGGTRTVQGGRGDFMFCPADKDKGRMRDVTVVV